MRGRANPEVTPLEERRKSRRSRQARLDERMVSKSDGEEEKHLSSDDFQCSTLPFDAESGSGLGT